MRREDYRRVEGARIVVEPSDMERERRSEIDERSRLAAIFSIIASTMPTGSLRVAFLDVCDRVQRADANGILPEEVGYTPSAWVMAPDINTRPTPLPPPLERAETWADVAGQK